MTALVVLTGLAYADDPPMEGMFWSAAKTNEPPYPFNFAPLLPAIPIGTNSWLIDDTTVDYSSVAYQSSGPPPPPGDEPPSENIPGTNSPVMIYTTNDFWIEILGVTNDLASLALHNVYSNWYGQILSRTNIEDQAWRLGPISQNVIPTNFLVFDPVPTYGLARQFYRGVEGFPVVAIEPDSYLHSPCEPTNSVPEGGQIGIFNIRLSDALSTDLTVYYQMSGSAQNGADYTNLSGSVTVPAGFDRANIFIAPYYDTLVEFEESVTLTLILTNGYLVDPDRASATEWIKDNLTNVFQVVVTNLNNPIGIDYHQPSNSLIVSVNWNNGEPNNFVRVYTNGGTTVVSNWSGIAGEPDEVKLATATHLEGVITLTNDASKWGPWAGKAITGDEVLHRIYAIDDNGAVVNFDLEINPEDSTLFQPIRTCTV